MGFSLQWKEQKIAWLSPQQNQLSKNMNGRVGNAISDIKLCCTSVADARFYSSIGRANDS